MGLSCGVVCVILSLAVLIQYLSVIDTHTRTDIHTTTAYTALSIASRSKNLKPKQSYEPVIGYISTDFSVGSSSRFLCRARIHTLLHRRTDAADYPTHASVTAGVDNQ